MSKPKEKDTKMIGANAPIILCSELESRAASISMSTSKYCTLVLLAWVKSGKKLMTSEQHTKGLKL